eukprot:Ihof_evm30s9 gene=Ihof_evmTU30s9
MENEILENVKADGKQSPEKEKNNQIALPHVTADIIDQEQARNRLKRDATLGADDTGSWMDKERRNVIAYEYLCHLEETKKWLEKCTQEELPATVDLEDTLTNGVVLAKLAKFFNKSDTMKKKKIYDPTMSVFNESGLKFRHTDNINHWFFAMEEIGLPTVFIPTTTDLYNKKNLPRVIYCIHALSHFLHKKGICERIEDLVGKVQFTEAEISTMQSALQQYGVAMPHFGKIAGVLAKELSATDAELHAAIIAINEAILTNQTDTIYTSLQLPAAQIENLEEDYKECYHQQLLRKILLKRKLAAMNTGTKEADDDIYQHMLTQEEIQRCIDTMNLDRVIREINSVIRTNQADILVERLRYRACHIKGVQVQYANAYLNELKLHQDAKAQAGEVIPILSTPSEFEGYVIPNKIFPQPDNLTLKEIQVIVEKVTKEERMNNVILKNLKSVLTIQAWLRGCKGRKLAKEARLRKAAEELAKKEAEEAQKRLEEEEKKRLEKEKLEKERLEKEKLEKEILEKEKLEKERLEKERLEKEKLEKEEKRLAAIAALKIKGHDKSASKIQAWYRRRLESASHKKKLYKDITTLEAPPVESICAFVDLLAANDEDISDELELQRLNNQAVEDIRENTRLEQELSVMDAKIGLLVKNRISLDEAIKQSHKLRKKSKGNIGMLTGGAGVHQKEWRDRLLHYQHLFYLLQTKPEYLAKLIFLLPPTASSKFIENVVLLIYNFAQNNREEYLLLKLFKCAIAEEVEKVDEVKEFSTGNLLVIKMVVHYNRGLRERLFLRELLVPLVNEVLITKMNLNANPVDIYKKWISQTEVETGNPSQLPFDVTVPEALKHDIVKKRFEETVQNIMTITEKFLVAICQSTDNLPYGMRSIAMDMRILLTQKFPEVPSDDVVKVIGNLIFFRYMNPAIVSPDVFDVVQVTAANPIQQDQRRNLGEISKILQLIASNTRFDEEEQPHFSEMNKFISKCFPIISEYFIKASTTIEPEEHFGIDQYSDVTLTNKPVITISAKEIRTTHAFLREHIDDLCTENDDPLKTILNELGDLPDRPLNSGPGVDNTPSPILGDGEIKLVLTPKLSVVDEDAAKARLLSLKTKGLVVQVIRCQPGDNLLDILNTPATPAEEERHEKHVETLKAIKEKMGSNGKEKMEGDGVDPDNQIDYTALMLEQACGSLESIKTIIKDDCVILEKAGLVTKELFYQELLNAIAHDIKYQASQRVNRKKQIAKLRSTLSVLKEKKTIFDEKTIYYQSYVDTCIQKMNSSQKLKKPIKHLFSLNKLSGKPSLGSGKEKISAKKLHKQGILVEITGVATS